MADQEFLASFAVEIDESGVSRLQAVLEENRQLAEDLAAAFTAVSEAIHTLSEDLGTLPGFSGGIAEEGFSGMGGLPMGLDLGEAQKDYSGFTEQMKKPVKLSANASAIVSAGRSAYESVRSIFSNPIVLSVKTQIEDDGEGTDDSLPGMSTGGRFTRPTDVQVAEDGDAEYIIPVKKEDRALPLLRQLLGELSPGAREQLGNSQFTIHNSQLDGLSAGNAVAGSITQNNSNVSAPVNIHVQASGASAEAIGQSLYDTAERYLLRTLKGAI